MDFPGIIKIVIDLGFTVAAVLAGGFFIGVLLRYILAGVVNDVQEINSMCSMLNNRIRVANNELVRIDALISSRFGLKVDLDRLSRTDGKADARRD